MGLKVQRYATAEAYEAEFGAYPAAFESEGAEIVSSGSGPRATVTVDFGSAGKVRLMLIGGVPMEKR